ncbi:MAG: tetratricopeptide repeat protein [Gemmatimonadota bacterium]|nr:tetratricopeptide repeat protein [Gemmatimonadota bacterium]
MALLRPDGVEDPIGKRRRKLALLAVLALSGRPLTRDFLSSLFWGDEDETRARHSLSDALSHIRSVLGPGSIATRQADIALADGIPLRVDAVEFSEAARRGDWTTATSIYGGAFLDCVYVDNAPTFEQWQARERDRLQNLFLKACDKECLRLARERSWDEVGALARRWLEVAPLSGDAALYLLNAIKAPGTRESDRRALDTYASLRARLAREYEVEPEPAVAHLASEIAARLEAAERVTSPPTPAVVHQEVRALPSEAAPARAVAEPAPASTPPPRRRYRTWVSAAAVAIVAVAIAAVATIARGPRTAAIPKRPVIAIVGIQNISADTAVAWLASALPQMLVADLSRSASVDIVDPAQVRDVLARRGAAPGADPALSDLLDIGRRVGASVVVNGGVTRLGGKIVLNLGVHDVASGAVLGLFTVANDNALALVDAGASQLLDAANAHVAGPRFAEVETANLDAYRHYLTASRYGLEGRFEEAREELDAAIQLDSGFVPALRDRLASARAMSDPAVVRQLSAALARSGGRSSERDRIEQAMMASMMNGDRDKPEMLGRELLRRFPRDPRAYSAVADLYLTYGDWNAAERILQTELALDSLANEAGSGPCAPCLAYRGLTTVRLAKGDLVGAERAARRWSDLQPELPGAWSNLATALSSSGQLDGALAASARAITLSGGSPAHWESYLRLLVMARRFGSADTLVREWRDNRSAQLRHAAMTIGVLLQRERGQFRASLSAIDAIVAADSAMGSLRLLRGDAMSRAGDYAGAARLFERLHHREFAPASFASWDGDRARSFCWEHALEAQAIAPSGDTLWMHALADSIDLVSRRSYYSRDWHLAHHVRGLIAMQARRYADAEREFSAARWGVAGWTVTVRGLARAQLAQRRPADAVATLRQAYEGPLDSTGIFLPRSEIDYWMALAMRQAGMSDSAVVYREYVRRAWREADPDVKRQLTALNDGGAK